MLRTLDDSPNEKSLSEMSPLVRTYPVGNEVTISKSVHGEDMTFDCCFDHVAIVKLAPLRDWGPTIHVFLIPAKLEDYAIQSIQEIDAA
jgi:hypothetical protein